MQKRVLAVALVAALAGAVAAAPAMAQYVQAAPTAPEKKLTPQQQKMKDCGAEWQTMKTSGKTEGKTWAQFRKECLQRKT